LTIIIQYELDCAPRKQPLPRPQSQAKVIQDSNPDFRINLEQDPYVSQIAPKM